MRYEVLGRVRTVDDVGPAALSAPKTNLLLALLVAHAGRVVTPDRIITELWGGDEPRRAQAAIHVHIHQIRRFLERPGRRDGPVITHPHGYLLDLDGDELDLDQFTGLLEDGRERVRAGRFAAASATLRAGLALWRGAAFEGLSWGPAVGAHAAWAEESRLGCRELLVESELMMGLHREQVRPLSELTAAHPLREGFYGQLMLALYRSNRQADALAVYQRARATLRRELGLEPCRALRDLQQAILSADHWLLAHSAPAELRAVS
ncbi:AfsR/SARP family transcriptional regulator [Actinomadura sp. WMMB 499]|uniref:AfsR/SARP family transcriptional regulator n=1 Tax=Actinomadura sp. WMMB 499 TaxID=1219491 RepID=UPI00124643AE|nr:AfsR/SARP family transcriptional regulator [Actinomadura sp. WMMB 499]QFG20254.1 AfsR/SARP family transcriptional regulator [Actinomadura sp. WMMB 499]